MLDSNVNTPVRAFGVPGVGFALKNYFVKPLTHKFTMSPDTCAQLTSGKEKKAVGSPACGNRR